MQSLAPLRRADEQYRNLDLLFLGHHACADKRRLLVEPSYPVGWSHARHSTMTRTPLSCSGRLYSVSYFSGLVLIGSKARVFKGSLVRRSSVQYGPCDADCLADQKGVKKEEVTSW